MSRAQALSSHRAGTRGLVAQAVSTQTTLASDDEIGDEAEECDEGEEQKIAPACRPAKPLRNGDPFGIMKLTQELLLLAETTAIIRRCLWALSHIQREGL